MMAIMIDHKQYLTTEEAAEISGYTTDYVGQLCRADKIDCQRISGHWFVEEESLRIYTGKELPKQQSENILDMYSARDGDSCIYEGKEYISSAQAAKITGYAQDYIGQLARGGHVSARKVGKRWFVERESLLKHKEEVSEQLKKSANLEKDGAISSAPAEVVTINKEKSNVPHTKLELKRGESDQKSPAFYNFNVRYISEEDHHPIIPLQKKPLAEADTGEAQVSSVVHIERVAAPAHNHDSGPATGPFIRKPHIEKAQNQYRNAEILHPVQTHRITDSSSKRHPVKSKYRILQKAVLVGTIVISGYAVLYMLSGHTLTPKKMKDVIMRAGTVTHSIDLERLQKAIPGKTYRYEKTE